MTTDKPPDRRCYRFDRYVVDPRNHLLWRDGVLVPLTSKAFEVLATLLHHRERVVEKDELLARVWPKTVVEENTLTRHISTLRKALDERPDEHQYILTVPGHGYQFVADVVELEQRPPELRHTAESDPAAEIAAPHLTLVPGTKETSTAERPRHPWHAPVAYALLVALVALVAGVSVFVARELRRSEARAPQRVIRQFTFQSGLQREPAWSPDGHWVAYTSDRAGNSDIWVQNIAETHPIRITSAADEDSQADWAPDGQWLVFRSERDAGGLYVVPARGGTERRIAHFGYRPRWSPDGSLVLFSSSGHEGGVPKMYVVGVDGAAPRPIRPDVMGDLKSLDAAWQPDGRGVSIWGQATTGWTFRTVPIRADEPVTTSTVSPEVERRIKEAGLTLTRFVWSRSGRHLFFEGRAQEVVNLWRITVDPATLAWIGGPDRLTTGTGEDADLALSPDGARLVFSVRSARTRVWLFPFNAETGQITGTGQPITSGGAGEQDASALVDGSKLAYSAVRGGRHELWERSIPDGRDRLLIAGSGWTRKRPQWSPDGMQLAYFRTRTDSTGARLETAVAVLPLGGGVERLLTGPGDVVLVPSDWSPDGEWLLGMCRHGASQPTGTCLMKVGGGAGPKSVARVIDADPKHNLFEQRFSPDQRWISFIAVNSTDAGVSTIYVVPLSGGPRTPITDGLWYDDKPHWAPDGRTIYFVSNRKGLLNVWGRRFDLTTGTAVGAPFQVTSFDSPRQTLPSQLSRMQFDLAADRLFLPITETSAELWILENVDR